MSFFRPFRRPDPTASDNAVAALIERFEEPTAICESHGVIVLSNGAWRAQFGETPEPLRSGHGLFVTFLRARREGRASGTLHWAGTDHPVRVATLGGDRYVLRLQGKNSAAPSVPRAESPTGLTAFAHPSPFGAALIAGSDPISGRMIEFNDALASIAAQPVKPGGSLSAPTRRSAMRRDGPGRSKSPCPPRRSGRRICIWCRRRTAGWPICSTSPTRRPCNCNWRNATRWRRSANSPAAWRTISTIY
jgi:hypothetical protein